MKFGRGKVNLLRLRMVGVATWIAVLPWPVLAGDGTGCAAEQRVVFSCSTAKKLVAVCASPNLNASSGQVQYRVSRAGALELSYPSAGADWRTEQTVQSGTLLFSGGGGAFMSFTNAPYRYVVYSASGRGWGSKAGVVVEHKGRRIAHLKCQGKVISELGPDLFMQAGIADAAASFELP